VTKILGIESSCDETAAAILEDGSRVLSSVVASQMATHRPYGGVVPELASREHLRAIVPVVREAFSVAGLGYGDVQAVAVTHGPGLAGALLVGITYAKALAWSLNVPLVGVNHLEGHVHAVLLEQRLRGLPEPEFPALALLVSGGHTVLVVAEDPTKFPPKMQMVGRTRDDAAGEAFDKVAKLLGLGYPGGPVIDRLAKRGNPDAVSFTPPKIKGNALDFSFSGIKTAVLRLVQAQPHLKVSREEECSSATLDLIASFQAAVVEDLWTRTRAATRKFDVRSVMVTGGVACNSGLRQRFQGGLDGLPVYFPRPALTTDNAAMIAAAAFPRFHAGEFARMDLQAVPQLPLV
jgi:N6-L-threonylcarbamoyladenine synthase